MAISYPIILVYLLLTYRAAPTRPLRQIGRNSRGARSLRASRALAEWPVRPRLSCSSMTTSMPACCNCHLKWSAEYSSWWPKFFPGLGNINRSRNSIPRNIRTRLRILNRLGVVKKTNPSGRKQWLKLLHYNVARQWNMFDDLKQ